MWLTSIAEMIARSANFCNARNGFAGRCRFRPKIS